MPVNAVPTGYHAITPYLIVHGAADAIAWYCKVLGGKEIMRLPGPGGRVGHAEIQIGGSRIMLADDDPERDIKAPGAFGGSPVSLVVYLPDVDTVVTGAAAAGATVQSPPADKFYGDRMASLADPFGHTWHIATHIEDVSEEELRRRLEAMTRQV